MNLRIDLILPTEQRSASLLSPKMAVRTAGVAIPLILAAVIGISLIKTWNINSELSAMEQQWAIDKPKQEAAIKLRTDLEANKNMLAEIKAWEKVHVNFCKVISEIIKETQGNVQYETLRLSEAIQPDGTRNFTISIKGRAFGEESESSILSLRKKLGSNKYLDPLVFKVEGSIKLDDSAGSNNSNVRIFQIDCMFEPRKFE